jgi:two-component system sensor histidine kinase/response regulator
LLAIINDILDFSKVEAGKLELEVIDFDVTQIVEEVASLLARQAHSKSLELMAHASLGLTTALRGDPARIRQVLLNLTSNGIKFTDQGDVMLRAWVTSETDTQAQVRFEVSDTGMGIGAEDQQRLFQAFSQIDASTTRRFGGTGLGLAISTQLVEAMGGHLTVVSAVGQGSTFTFTLTLARGGPLRGPASAPQEHLLDGAPVLVVGGSATNRLILHEQLAGWDMLPQLATSGAAALQLLHRAVEHHHPIPVALLDLSIPGGGGSGIDLVRRISQDPTLGQTRLVALSSTDANVDLIQPMVFAHLSKPVRSSQLYDCLVKALAPARLPSRLSARSGATAMTPSPAVLGRLLVAEDNATNQLVARAMLGQLGYRVDIAANGLEALDALERTSYVAILMDCQMPEMDGYTATEAIRRSETRSGRHLPIIAITAGAFEGDQERCRAAGMDDYIAKPIKLIELESVLNKWVRTEA